MLHPGEWNTDLVRSAIEDLSDTQQHLGGIGIAAPQIGISLRIAIIEFDQSSSRYPGMGNLPRTIFINSVLTVLDETSQTYWEGCLSVPGIRGRVSRPRKVRVDYLNEMGAPQSLVAEGFLATVLQHELDHLDGVLFVDRVRQGLGETELAYLDEYQEFHSGS